MATYKLIQDIEAEDHILGPLTLRQFIFALITALLLYLCFFVTTKGAAFLLIILVPPTLFFGFFALPIGKDQPTEIWALAKLRFLLKPRNRTWDQSGLKELVTITAPKRAEPVLTNGLSQYEVQSRLKALADTIDSRGWAIKNVTVGSMVQPIMGGYSSDRLIDVAALPQAVPDYSTGADSDVLDEYNNPVAQQFENMITRAEQQHRQQLINQMNAPAGAAAAPVVPGAVAPQAAAAQPASTQQQWFMRQPAAPGTQPVGNRGAVIDQSAPETVLAPPQTAPAAAAFGSMRTLQPLGSPAGSMPAVAPAAVAAAAPGAAPAPAPAVTPPADPAILNLAKNNDLNVATLAREAKKAKGEEPDSDGEVVISLH